MSKINWHLPPSVKNIVSTTLQVVIVIGILAVLVYLVTWDDRLEGRIRSLETQPKPETSATTPTLPEPVINPHAQHIATLEAQADMPLTRLARLIIRDEGKRNSPYLDSKGIVTIGIGRSLQSNGITPTELRAIVREPDYETILRMGRVSKGRIYVESLSLANKIFPYPLTEHDIMLLLADDLKVATHDAVSVFGDTWQKIDKVRQEAIVDILYNLGLPHFKQFKHFIQSVKDGNWNKAAADLLMSEAARKHITRYHRSASVIQTGDQRYFELK